MNYLERFDAEFAPKLVHRANTFRLMFELLEKMESPLIVETGCIRELGCWEGDGQSTILFDDYTKFDPSARLITIDNNLDHMRLVDQETDADSICMDSVKALASFDDAIELLYLDSFDFDPANPHPSSLHHLKELAAAQKNLRPGSIIAVDDNHPDGTGKGAYVRDYLANLGMTPVMDAYQVVWIWK